MAGISVSMKRSELEKKVDTIFLLEKLGRGMRIMSENVETSALPSRVKKLLARLDRVPVPGDRGKRPAHPKRRG